MGHVAALLGHRQGLDGELVEGAGEVEALAVGAAEAGQPVNRGSGKAQPVSAAASGATDQV
jgi:hypothetical protein